MLAEGFEETETIAVVDMLRRAGGRVFLISLKEDKEAVKGSRGVYCLPDMAHDSLADSFDAIFLPGGAEGVAKLHADKILKEKLFEMFDEEKLIASICAASSILADYGILNGRNATSHPSFKKKTDINGTLYSEERVVVDGNIITSRSPGTAIECAFAMVEYLFGKKRVAKLNKGVMAIIP